MSSMSGRLEVSRMRSGIIRPSPTATVAIPASATMGDALPRPDAEPALPPYPICFWSPVRSVSRRTSRTDSLSNVSVAGIVHGQKTRAFFHKLVNRQYASAYACRHNRGRIYHVHHFGLYRAIDEPNSAYRRPVTAARVAERLMVLDSVLANPGLDWLTTATEKVAYFTQAPCFVPVHKLPRLTARTDSTETDS